MKMCAKTETGRRGLLEKTVWATVALSAALACACAACAADVITYEEFGAAGDGKTDDMAAIVAAHAAANEKGLPVRAGDGRTYYIGGVGLTADIRTDVDFGAASFVIDDSHHPEKYDGPFVFGMFNPKNTGSDYVEKHPCHVTEEVELRNVTTKSGKPVRLSPNKWMFRNVKVKQL